MAYSGWGGSADSSWRSSLQDNGSADDTDWSEPAITSLDDKWIRIECWLKQSSPNVKDGQYKCWAHTGGVIGSPNYLDITPAKTRLSSSVWEELHIGSYNSRDDETTGQGKAIVYTDDVYVDITPARVELGNAATFSGCSRREIQIPSAWSTNSITITANQGAFASGQTAYLYVVDSTGAVNANGYPVTIGSGGSTVPTDTVKPVVSSFSVTPTTLTAGASLTASYTVTDNTALARAELWRAPQGTNCTDTVKTGCVWTQLNSANISGTSKSGTLTHTPDTAGTFYYGLHAVDTAGNVGVEANAVKVTINAAAQTGGVVISSVSGTVNHGSSVTVSGSGFGIHALNIESLQSNIESGTVGNELSKSGWIKDWGWADPIYATDSFHSGSKSLKCVVTDANYNCAFAYDMPNVSAGQRFYATWWVKYNGGTNGQWKMFRASGNETIVDGPQEAVLFNWLSSARQLAVDPGTSNGQTFWPESNVYPLGDNNWYRVELDFVAGSTGANNGTLTVRRTTESGTITNYSASSVNTHSSSGNTWSYAIWQNYAGNGISGNSTIWFDDIYVQYNTIARAELCFGSNWSNRGKCEIQVPTSWSANSIQTSVNAGNFTSGQTAYFYVVDSTGAANTNGYPVTIGSGGGSTPADTTKPIVSSFSVTPTTLTAGASLTASYTVTDNTALARAELWRAPQGTNCTDTVKTGCVWTQANSANISGTSRSGTLTHTPDTAGTYYYGLHAVDAAGNMGVEATAVKVTVSGAQTSGCFGGGICLVNGTWSTTFNCSDWTRPPSGADTGCDGISRDSDGASGYVSSITSTANYAGGGGGKGFLWQIGNGPGDSATSPTGPNLALNWAGSNHVWIRWYVRIPAGLDISYAGKCIQGWKVLYVWDPSRNANQSLYIDANYNNVGMTMYDRSNRIDGQYGFPDAIGSNTADGSWVAIEMEFDIPNRTWRYWFYKNNIDSPTPKFQSSSVNYPMTKIGLFSFPSNIRSSACPNTPQSLYFDDITISTNGRIGPVSGGTTPTCSNCCSSTQTCSTAFTTVGTCTRCCATACQTAAADTTAPQVTAFSATPATLTQGSPVTASYTVTDNTALARAELWRAPQGTSCSDTVKTDCVWTKSATANISGTTKTGTLADTPPAGTYYYGLHAVDAAGNIGYETAAIKVTANTAGTACYKFTTGIAIPANFGSPYDLAGNSQNLLLNTACQSAGVHVNVGTGNQNQYVWRQGHIWRNNAWQAVNLSGPASPYGTNWFQGSASADITLPAAELNQENIFIAYVCTWIPANYQWKCGCRDSFCAKRYWQMQKFGNY